MKESRKRQKEEEEKSPATSRFQTHNLQTMRRVLYCSSTTTALMIVKKSLKSTFFILIKKSLVFSVVAEARDADENLLSVRISTSGTEIILVSIYGPNSININFFTLLQKY